MHAVKVVSEESKRAGPKYAFWREFWLGLGRIFRFNYSYLVILDARSYYVEKSPRNMLH